MAEQRAHRRVNVQFTMLFDDGELKESGDLIVPEPVLAANLVGTLLLDWSISEIKITAENSVEDVDAEVDE